MDDQKWAAIITIATIISLRILDWFMPKGHHSKWTEKHGMTHEDKDMVE